MIASLILSLIPLGHEGVEKILPHAIWGVYAVRTDTGEVVADRNSDLSFTPASCLKVVTTAAALHVLGPEYRFETRLEYDGEVIGGNTLRGALWIRGGGDPCLGSERIAGPLASDKQLSAWADAVCKLGIAKIEGKVAVDLSRWEQALAVPSWAWEDLGNYYGAGASALSFHENSYALVFQPGTQVGEPAKILRTEPRLSHPIQCEVTTGPVGSGDRACIYGSEFSPLQFVRGTVPAGVNEFAIRGAIPDPASFCAKRLEEELKKRGIAIEGKETLPAKKRTVIHTTASPPIQEIVNWTNRKSVNLYAEHLLKEMGYAVYKEGSTEAGVRAVSDFCRSQGIDLDGFCMVDGSGLSRKNLITPKQLVQLLVKMNGSVHLFDSLSEHEGGVRAKSGSMAHTKGYAGYVGKIAFAAFVNQCCDGDAMDKALQALLAELSRLVPAKKQSSLGR